MTDQMRCEDFADVAAELALGVLTGRERAQALAHLDHCDACREHVSQLTSAGEQLLALLPTSEPPPGFETRVMERIGLAAPAPAPAPIPAPAPAPIRRPRNWLRIGSTRRLLALAAVVAAIVAGGVSGWGLHGAGTQGTAAGVPLSQTAFVSADHKTVGRIFVYDGTPRWLYMSVDTTSGTANVRCQVIGKDGRVTTIGLFWLDNGYGSWGSPVPEGTGPLAGARLVGSDGRVLATARFALR